MEEINDTTVNKLCRKAIDNFFQTTDANFILACQARGEIEKIKAAISLSKQEKRMLELIKKNEDSFKEILLRIEVIESKFSKIGSLDKDLNSLRNKVSKTKTLVDNRHNYIKEKFKKFGWQ